MMLHMPALEFPSHVITVIPFNEFIVHVRTESELPRATLILMELEVIVLTAIHWPEGTDELAPSLHKVSQISPFIGASFAGKLAGM